MQFYELGSMFDQAKKKKIASGIFGKVGAGVGECWRREGWEGAATGRWGALCACHRGCVLASGRRD